MKNIHLATITENQPDYLEVRSKFFEWYPVICRIGGANFAALTKYSIQEPEGPGQVLALLLCGFALGRIEEIINHPVDDVPFDIDDIFEGWNLVQGQLKAIMPDQAVLAGLEEVKIPSAKGRQNRRGQPV